ncbi:MAG: hypothetical protein AB8H47_09335 [Bacteroidia bacterium]
MMKFFLSILFGLTINACSSPLPKGVQTIEFSFAALQNANFPKKEAALIKALERRFEAYYPQPVKIQKLGKNQFEIKVPGLIDESMISALVETPGRLFFAETSAGKAASQSFRLAGLEEKLAGKLNMEANHFQENSPIIGYAFPRDTARISNAIAEAERLGIIKSDLTIAWGQVPMISGGENANMLELYAIRQSDGQYQGLRGDMITEVKTEPDQTGKWAILLSFDDAGSEAWAEMTEDRVSDFIAMLIDGKAWSVPRVQSSITGGKTMISGRWEEDEAKLWTAIMSSPLPENIQLTKLSFDPEAVFEP